MFVEGGKKEHYRYVWTKAGNVNTWVQQLPKMIYLMPVHTVHKDLIYITIAQPHSERTMCEFWKKRGGERGGGGTENTLMISFNEEISIADMTVVEPCGTV